MQFDGINDIGMIIDSNHDDSNSSGISSGKDSAWEIDSPTLCPSFFLSFSRLYCVSMLDKQRR